MRGARVANRHQDSPGNRKLRKRFFGAFRERLMDLIAQRRVQRRVDAHCDFLYPVEIMSEIMAANGLTLEQIQLQR